MADDFASGALKKSNWFAELWTAGGKGVSGSADDTELWLIGGRVGKLLTPGMEYNLEVVPAFLVFQEETVYGLSITPLLVKFNLKTKGQWIPYLECGAGLLFTSSDVPQGTSSFNFTPQAGFGVQIFSRERRAIRVAARYMHISNGGLKSPNPGINSIQFVVGYEWFR
jgi:hypothetical protein